VDDVVIWGLTFRMLIALGERLIGMDAEGAR
jgi:hypothetical protein